MNRETTAVRHSKLNRLYLLFVESFRDSGRNLTTGSIRKALFLLSVPMVLEMVLESVFAIVDIVFVAQLGADAIAVVGLTEAMATIIYAICIGFGMAVTAVISRRIGENNPEAASISAGQAIWITAVLATVTSVLGVIFAEDLLRLMGASPSVIDGGLSYTKVLLGGSASIFFIHVLNAVFRGAGDASIAMRSLWLASGINIVLDPCLIFGLGPFPEMGVAGAAVATTIGRSTGIAYQVWHLIGGSGRIRLQLTHMALNGRIMLRMIELSVGGIGQFLIATSSWLFMMRIVATFGSNTIAGFTIALRLFEFVVLPAWGLGNAAATLVGQNLGAGKPERAAQSAWQAAKYNTIVMLVVGAVFVLFPHAFISLFTNDPAISATGVLCVRYFGLGLPLYAVGMIMAQSLNGAGDTRTPTILNFICFWLTQVPLALLLAKHVEPGSSGVLWAIIIAETLLSVLAVMVFRRGHWQHKLV